jgi:ribosomal protein S18 acetylase RimI-like enzyme
MNINIVENLFELWDHVGQQNQNLAQTDHWNYVNPGDSDWPKRVYKIQGGAEVFNDIKSLYAENKVPGLVTVSEELPKEVALGAQVVHQKNMALTLSANNKNIHDSNIQQVLNKTQAKQFAETASFSFGYYVDESIIRNLLDQTDKIKLYIYLKDDVCLGCGILFIDSKGYAGLHMIGTVPEGRGQGIGKKMTIHLLADAQLAKCPYVVLHASAMGENIYTKLGFQSYGTLKTYKIT